MKSYFAFFFVGLLVFSCGSSFDVETEKNKILDIHDEVMPKIGEVMNLKKKVLDKAETLEGESANKLRNLAQELDEANQGMMTWMRQWSEAYKNISDSENQEEQKKWLADQMEKVQEVKEAINSSIKEAKSVLN